MRSPVNCVTRTLTSCKTTDAILTCRGTFGFRIPYAVPQRRSHCFAMTPFLSYVLTVEPPRKLLAICRTRARAKRKTLLHSARVWIQNPLRRAKIRDSTSCYPVFCYGVRLEKPRELRNAHVNILQNNRHNSNVPGHVWVQNPLHSPFHSLRSTIPLSIKNREGTNGFFPTSF